LDLSHTLDGGQWSGRDPRDSADNELFDGGKFSNFGLSIPIASPFECPHWPTYLDMQADLPSPPFWPAFQLTRIMQIK
jgi:hypothetical protein